VLDALVLLLDVLVLLVDVLLLDVLVLLELVLLVLLVLASVPPSGGGLQGPQVPMVLPTATMQVSPTQQSALVVQVPQFGTQGPPW